ncbi:MAG: addiction module protein [Gemmatimonadota bacterium]|nr:addiction module protein [Gemmatimonadota bacterium]
MVYPAIDIERLTVGERLQLIEQVWDSLRHGAGALPLNDAERAVIEARRGEHRDEPGAAVAWESVRTDLVSDQEADEQRTRSSKRG